MGELSADVVDAVYRALLGRPADPEGLRAWMAAGSVEDLVRGLTGSPEGVEHVRRTASDLGLAAAADLLAAERLREGDGMVALRHGAPRTGGTVLPSLPFDALGAGLGATVAAAVLGPYARELASELVARGIAASATAGLRAMPEAPDLLVATDEEYPRALALFRPGLLERVRRRVAAPVEDALGAARADRELRLTARRVVLHEAGFVEVARHVHRHHGGVTDLLDVTHTSTDPWRPLPVVAAPAGGPREPAASWLVADRVGAHDRA